MGQTAAFIGIMGRRMAKNVLTAGHALRVYNRTAAKTEELRKLGDFDQSATIRVLEEIAGILARRRPA